MRRDVIAHMRQEERFFSAMFDEGAFGDYLEQMARAKTWGDELSLRAFADAFQVCVHVVTSTDGAWHLQYSPAEGVPPRKHVFLTYLSPVHYDALTATPPWDEGTSPDTRGMARTVDLGRI